MVKAVIFDIDGTIFDYNAAKEAALAAVEKYAVEALAITAEEFRQAYDWGRSRTRELVVDQGAAYSRLLYAQHALEYLGLPPVSHALEMEKIYWKAFLDAIKPYEGVKDFMAKLKAKGIKIGICTDMTAAVQHQKLRKAGVADLIDALVISEEAGIDKPARKIYQLILEKLGVKAENAVMIGDNIERDVKGAEAMGIKGIWFTYKTWEGPSISNYTDGRVEKLCGL